MRAFLNILLGILLVDINCLEDTNDIPPYLIMENILTNFRIENKIRILTSPETLYSFFDPQTYKITIKYVTAGIGALFHNIQNEHHVNEMKNIPEEDNVDTKLRAEVLSYKSNVGDKHAKVRIGLVEKLKTNNKYDRDYINQLMLDEKKLRLTEHITKFKNYKGNTLKYKNITKIMEEEKLEEAIVEAYRELHTIIPFQFSSLSELNDNEFYVMFDFLAQEVALLGTQTFIQNNPKVVPKELDQHQFKFLFGFFLKDLVVDLLIRATSTN